MYYSMFAEVKMHFSETKIICLEIGNKMWKHAILVMANEYSMKFRVFPCHIWVFTISMVSSLRL